MRNRSSGGGGRVWYGTLTCEWPKCSNKSYWEMPTLKGASNATTTIGKQYLCGVHSRRHKSIRKPLPRDPDAKMKREIELTLHQRTVEECAADNERAGRRGRITVRKMRMMRAPALKSGTLNVFPNNRHGKRKDGYGAPELSPMRLGPVNHKQPGLPPALNIENYHQFNKVFPNEVDEKTNDPLPVFYTRQRAAYLDPVPHRHKFPLSEMKKLGKGKNANVPLYSVHKDENTGHERRYTYVESRQFYCKQYELLAKKTEQFRHLKQRIEKGMNVCIWGYDGYPIEESADAIYRAYIDASRPFGHELVLFTLLVLSGSGNGINAYPWRVFANTTEASMRAQMANLFSAQPSSSSSQ